VLWDIRVRPEARGVGIPLFRYAVDGPGSAAARR
jgi:hypothetical protein